MDRAGQFMKRNASAFLHSLDQLPIKLLPLSCVVLVSRCLSDVQRLPDFQNLLRGNPSPRRSGIIKLSNSRNPSFEIIAPLIGVLCRRRKLQLRHIIMAMNFVTFNQDYSCLAVGMGSCICLDFNANAAPPRYLERFPTLPY